MPVAMRSATSPQNLAPSSGQILAMNTEYFMVKSEATITPNTKVALLMGMVVSCLECNFGESGHGGWGVLSLGERASGDKGRIPDGREGFWYVFGFALKLSHG